MIFTKVMILAPPDFPFPLEEMAILILKQFLPNGVPWKGFFEGSELGLKNLLLKKDTFLPISSAPYRN